MSQEYYNLRFVVTTPTLAVTEYNCLKESCNQVRNAIDFERPFSLEF